MSPLQVNFNGFFPLLATSFLFLVLASHFEFMFIGHCHCFNPHLKVVTGLIDAQLQDVYKLFGIDESITSQFNHMASTLQKIKLDWEESFLMRSIAVTFSGKEVSKPAIANIILPWVCSSYPPPLFLISCKPVLYSHIPYFVCCVWKFGIGTSYIISIEL